MPVRDPVTAEDVEAAVALAVTTLETVTDRDWGVPASGLDWTCWESVEHLADDLFAYAGQLGTDRPPKDTYVPFGWEHRRPGGPALTVWVRPDGGTAGAQQVVETCGALLAAMVRAAPAHRRGWHPYGVSDAEGFAAMGVVEVLVHLHDVGEALGAPVTPDPALCRRALDRLFPDAPQDADPWATLLWATGRAALPGRDRLVEWRWDATVR